MFGQDEFASTFNVSHETIDKLAHYQTLLSRWNRTINLVSKPSLEHLWHRHFADSAQLIAHIPNTVERIIDFGSGAGLPAIVLAVMRPDIDYMLIESDRRKSIFLQTLIHELKLKKIIIKNDRIENINLVESGVEKSGKSPASLLFTARAFAPLGSILHLIEQLYQNSTIHESNQSRQLLLLKGESAPTELTEAEQSWYVQYRTMASITKAEAVILKIDHFNKLL